MRLVSLCPSITHSLFRLGVGGDLVGITSFCVHPRAHVASIEKVGGTKNPKLDRIIQLQPDVVFLNREENRREDGVFLLRAGLRCHVSHPVNVDTAIDMLKSLSDCLGCPLPGEALISEIQAVRQRIREQKQIQMDQSWAYLIWRKPWMAVNRATYIHGLIAEVTGNNVFGGNPSPYPVISVTELAQARPDRIFLSSEPFPFKTKHIDELVNATGLEKERFSIVDGERLSWHGSMTAAGLAYVYDLFTTSKNAVI